MISPHFTAGAIDLDSKERSNPIIIIRHDHDDNDNDDNAS
jgi:hypothetical protein